MTSWRVWAVSVMWVLLWLGLPRPARPATYANYAALTSALFSGYKKELIPLEDSNIAVNVYFSMWLRSIQDLDEINQQLTFSAFFEVDWYDPNLSWNPALYNNTESFSYPQKEIWIPDITIMNSVESMTELGFDRNYVFVHYTGIVKWVVGGVFKTSCDIDVTYYPFDTQVCTVIMTTLVSTIYDVDLSISPHDSVSLEWYSESGSWSLKKFAVDYIPDTSMRTRVAFSITMERLRLYYIVTIIIPIVFLSLTATLVFALPVDSGEKMGTSITVLLAFAVYLTIVSEQMPKTSVRASLMAVYLTMLLGQTALGVLLSVWILNIHFRDDSVPPGRRLRRLVLLLRKLICKAPKRNSVFPCEDNSNGAGIVMDSKSDYSPRRTCPDQSSAETEELSWSCVAYILDRFLFYTFSMFLILLTIVCMSLMVIGGYNS